MRGKTLTRRSTTRADNWSFQPTGLKQAFAFVAIGALAATALVGTYAAFVFILAGLILAALDPAESGRTLLRFLPLLLIPLLALASTLWSDAPQRTARAAIQLLLTIIATVLVCRRIDERSLLLVLFVGFVGICLLAVPGIPAALSSRFPLAYPFESKNQLGFAAHLLFAIALAVACDARQRSLVRTAALASVPLALLLAWASQSAGAQTSFGLTLLLFVPLVIFGRLPLGWRIGLMVLIGALLIVALAFQPEIERAIDSFRSDVLQKDATLTGRTYLWEFAARVSAERPVLGHGYYAFWRQGSIDAEGLWRWGGIASRSGFNFHNAFVEMHVDLGLVGLILLITTCAAFASIAIWQQLLRPTVPLAFFIALQAVFYARSLGESGLIAPFSLTTALWIAAGVYALRNERTTKDRSTQHSGRSLGKERTLSTRRDVLTPRRV